MISLGDFGAVGNDSTPNDTAIAAWYAAIPNGGTGFIPTGKFRFVAPLIFDRPVNIVGDGHASVLVPDLNSDQLDAITFGTDVPLGQLVIERFSIIAEGNACRNAVVFVRINNSRIDLTACVRASGWAYAICGCECSRFRLVGSRNYWMPKYGEYPLTGWVACSSAYGAAVNANVFDVVLEGGAIGMRIEDQAGQGNNVITGCIQGMTGQGFYALRCLGLSLRDLHLEGNAGGHVLNQCSNAHVGANVLCVGSLGFYGCTGGFLDGLVVDSLTIDAECRSVVVGDVLHSTNGGGFHNYSASTILRGPIRGAGDV